MCCDNKGNGKRKEPVLILMPDLFPYQQDDAKAENCDGKKTMVVLFIAMQQRIDSDSKCQDDHEVLKLHIINDIDTKNG